MVVRSGGTKARNSRVDQAEGERGEGEGTAVWLSILLRDEAC